MINKLKVRARISSFVVVRDAHKLSCYCGCHPPNVTVESGNWCFQLPRTNSKGHKLENLILCAISRYARVRHCTFFTFSK